MSKTKVEELWEEITKLSVVEFYELMEKITEFGMEQRNAMTRYVKK